MFSSQAVHVQGWRSQDGEARMERTFFYSTLSADFCDSSRTRGKEGRGVIFGTKRGPLPDQNRALILSDPSADSVSFQKIGGGCHR